MPKIVDLTGRRFGALEVIKRVRDDKGRVAWLCACDCEQTCVAPTSQLTSGRKTSCGCGANRLALAHETQRTPDALQRRYQTPRKDSPSGVAGVYLDKASGRWEASIMHQGKRSYLGRYDDIEDAIQARKQAEKDILNGLQVQALGED